MKLYGIKNCNSVKKAVQDLQNHGFEFDFCDIKKIDSSKLDFWLSQKDFSSLLNLSGLTARKLGLNKEKLANIDKNELKNLVLSNLSIIKRPLIEHENKILIGKEYEKLL